MAALHAATAVAVVTFLVAQDAALALDTLAGQPLMLTPFLEAGDIKGAREAASVVPLAGSAKSYSGFLTTDKKAGSHLFFWLFPAAVGAETAPAVVWLQGGPGTSALRAQFLEHGPLAWDPVGREVRPRARSLATRHSVLYIDSPVGAGFSSTESTHGYAKSAEQAAQATHEALRQLRALFPELLERGLFVAGESYGGKFAAALGDTVAKGNTLQLLGVIIVNGLIDPATQLASSDLLYELGIVDERSRDIMREREALLAALLRQGKYDEARSLSLDECGGAMSPLETGFRGLTNLLLQNGSLDFDYHHILDRSEVRAALHVGDVPFVPRAKRVARHLRETYYDSSLPLLEHLLENYRILVLSGTFDICLPYTRAADYLRKMEWSGAQEFKRSRRVLWTVEGDVAGYAKTGGRLTEVIVRNAGHYLGQDQLLWLEDSIARFTLGIGFAT